ncbi:hypothetical protein DPMN_047738 [Dreissena polymorpha]|uniref:G-protein coupled receptors family 1 profile domain-containing protein n=1 Tax=Dreissena polymorpha TaxID=45954 RepID=A0A9D4DA00_DREPO|nr:hypothetical protein DPMN_047738 [Dreissena polymorpha]
MDACFPHDFLECHITYWIWRTVPVLLLAIGTFGNILNIVILLRKRMRQHSISVHLLFLAVADLALLWTSTFSHMYQQVYRINVRNSSAFLCPAFPWINYGIAGFSVWLLVIMTIERVLVTSSLELAKKKLSNKTAVIISCILLVICLLFPLHYFFGFRLDTIPKQTGNFTNLNEMRTVCVKVSETFENFYKNVWPVMIMTVLNIIPMVIIVSGNLTILINIVRHARQMARVHPENQNEEIRNNRRNRPLYKMLFLVCSCFVVTNLPYNVYLQFWDRIDVSTPRGLEKRNMYDAIFLCLAYCNFALNFVLYFVSGTVFKQEFRALVNACQRFVRNRLCFQRAVRDASTTITRIPVINTLK